MDRNLSMGEVAERHVMAALNALGHDMQAFDKGSLDSRRYTDTSKKGFRKADLRCSVCGARVEARGKSSAMIAMSTSPRRPFDAELGKTDWVGFVRLEKTRQGVWVPRGEPTLVSVAALSRTQASAHAKSKKADRGAETYLTWPTLVAPITGTVASIAKGAVLIRNERTQRMVPLQLRGLERSLHVYVRPGDAVEAGVSFLAGAVPILRGRALACHGHADSAAATMAA